MDYSEHDYANSTFNGSYEDEYYDYPLNITTVPELTVAHNGVKIISLIIYSLTFLLGVPGNAFVIWIAGLKMKRTVNVVWFINLAIADFLCCLSIPFSITDTLLETSWPYGSVMCKVIPPFVVLNMFASVFTLAFISLDRLALVVRPVWAQNHRSLVLAWALCGLAWVLALLLSLPSMILRTTVTNPHQNQTLCTYVTQEGDSLSKSLLAHMQMIRFLFGFLVPLLLIITSYILITLKVRSSSFRAKRAFKIIVAVVVAFFVCWLPYHAFGLAREYGRDEGLVLLLDQLSIALAFVNSCLNPLLYVFMGQDFKEKVRLSLKRILENAFSEDNTTHSYVRSKASQSRMTSSTV
ncbi:C3a anaphylatoxin chemotactic receptor [Alosa sapidissima]|uniref:C3a anaphylatoxin chemotactic receptor n=1 Tax=Alosa sapidissima TaxID=34773 RepID=UPI001C081F4E|nr:C3a anaphylatoxin chemotactic receptor [Alosa sapidissima]XP_041936325.1 C3a anaphylatoxin chemotactic receptor [Alosa sapidissima]